MENEATPLIPTFPLPSTVTRARGTVSETQALILLRGLAARFETNVPRLHWSKKQGGTYFPGLERIDFGPNSYRGVDVLLHEFAHHLQKIEKYKALAPEGQVLERWSYRFQERIPFYRKSIHGPDFFAALEDVATFAYGDHRHYSWHREYRSIAKKYRRRYGATTYEQNEHARDDALRRRYPIRTWDFGTVAAAPRKNVAAALDAKAAKARAWNVLVHAIRDAGGRIPLKGKGWTDEIRKQARGRGLSHLIPTGGNR